MNRLCSVDKTIQNINLPYYNGHLYTYHICFVNLKLSVSTYSIIYMWFTTLMLQWKQEYHSKNKIMCLSAENRFIIQNDTDLAINVLIDVYCFTVLFNVFIKCWTFTRTHFWISSNIDFYFWFMLLWWCIWNISVYPSNIHIVQFIKKLKIIDVICFYIIPWLLINSYML